MAENYDPSRQREDTEHSARNETRACYLRSCIETFAEEDAEEAAGNRTEQDYESRLLQRHTQQERHCQAESRLDHIFAQDSPAHTPVQVKTLRRCDQSCHEQGGAFRRVTQNGQALIKINWHVELDDGGKNTEHGSPKYGFLESSPQRYANASRKRQGSACAGPTFENREGDWRDRNRTDREAHGNRNGGLCSINSQEERNTDSG